MLRTVTACVTGALILCFIIWYSVYLFTPQSQSKQDIFIPSDTTTPEEVDYTGFFIGDCGIVCTTYRGTNLVLVDNLPDTFQCIEYDYTPFLPGDRRVLLNLEPPGFDPTIPIYGYSGVLGDTCNDDLVETCYCE